MAETVRYNIVLNDEVSAKLAAIEARFAALENKLNDSNDSLNKLGKGVNLSNLIQIGKTAFGVAEQIYGMASAHVQAAGDIQAQTNAIRVASGSAEEYDKNMKFLNDLTGRVPISLRSAIDGYKTWSGAIMETSLAGDKGRKIFEQVSIAAAAMGISADDTKGIFLAMGQMVSKGTVQSEELKGQLGERLPGAFLLAAKAMGVTTAKLGDMLKEGQVTAEQLLPYLGDQLENRFKPGLDAASGSINGMAVQFDNLLVRAQVAATPAISAVISGLLQLANTIATVDFTPILDSLYPIVITAGQIKDMFDTLFSGNSSGSVKIMATAFHSLMVPIYMVVDAVTILVELMVGLYRASSALATLNFEKSGEEIAKMYANMEEINKKSKEKIIGTYKNIWTDEKKTVGGPEEINKDTTKTPKTPTNKELKSVENSIASSAPKNVTISINSLIGQNTNIIQREGDKRDIDNFARMLKEALQQEVINVNIAGF